jgi:hypothetical protein
MHRGRLVEMSGQGHDRSLRSPVRSVDPFLANT